LEVLAGRYLLYGQYCTVLYAHAREYAHTHQTNAYTHASARERDLAHCTGYGSALYPFGTADGVCARDDGSERHPWL
jgi:hypothetical protein